MAFQWGKSTETSIEFSFSGSLAADVTMTRLIHFRVQIPPFASCRTIVVGIQDSFSFSCLFQVQ